MDSLDAALTELERDGDAIAMSPLRHIERPWPGGRPVGALLFTCNRRGRRMFGVADHDAPTIEELLGGIPLRLLRRRGARPDRGPQRAARIYRVNGAVR